MHKFFATLHGYRAGMIWYQLSLIALSLYGAWSVSVAIDMYYQTTNWVDKLGLQIFAWVTLLLLGSFLLTTWASLVYEVRQARGSTDDSNSRVKQSRNWTAIGIYTGVALMLVTEAAGRAAVFLRRWPDVSPAELIFTGALTLYFCIPVFLGPAMAHTARRIRAEADRDTTQRILDKANPQILKAAQTRIEQMSDEELLARFGHLLPSEVTGTLQALPAPKAGEAADPLDGRVRKNGRVQKE